MPNHDSPGLRERWWRWLCNVMVRLADAAERRETAHRVRRALPRGTKVVLPAGRCCGGREDPAHNGVWFVDRYSDDADDYRLVRELGREPASIAAGESTYAIRAAMELVDA